MLDLWEIELNDTKTFLSSGFEMNQPHMFNLTLPLSDGVFSVGALDVVLLPSTSVWVNTGVLSEELPCR